MNEQVTKAWTWVRAWWSVLAWPARAVVLLVAAAVLYFLLSTFTNAAGYARDHFAWWRTDRANAASDARVAELEQQMADRDKQIAVQAAEIEHTKAERDALKQALVELGANEGTINATLDKDREDLERARAFDGRGDVDSDALLDELRRAYPAPKRRRAP